MSDIHTRLKEIRKHFGLSIRDFSKEISYTHSVYGQIEIGKRELSDRILQLIVSKFNVNRDWILTGNGKMINDSQDSRLLRIIEIYNTVGDPLKESLLEMSNILLKLYKK
jgi:transcriptional regulator with XRE-family HTH domain